ncbi:MAG: hypothetical protein DRO00_03205 [Thermoproteota archaeon]|nr:MAG: hypothetical protein DRO00_03205 [Candidatus Korarchaeota archaeon]
MLEGWLLDAELTRVLVSMKLISDSSEIIKAEIPWSERLYLTPKNGFCLEELVNILDQANGVKRLNVERWYLPPRYKKEASVLVAEVKPSESKKILKHLKESGVAEIWNLFPSRIQRALKSLGITASSYICIEKSAVKLLEGPDSLEYSLPELRPLWLRFEGWAGRPNKPSWHAIDRIVLESDGWSRVIPVSRMEEVIDLLVDLSPHLLIFEGKGWRRLMEEVPGFKAAVDATKLVVLDKPPPLDVDLLGLIEWSRLSAIPLRIAVSTSIGKVLTSIEAFKALEWRYLVPEVRVTIEGWKSPSELLRADRGGVVLTPRPGIYWNVVQIDFNSLFPSIMAKNNISPETVNDPDCPGPKLEVPEVGHTICLGRRGLVAEVVGKLVERRAQLKALTRSASPDEIGRYDSAQKAIKWILVACFGYLGYRNARFGSIEAYECVTALARDIMFKSIRIAERMGFKVLHALVDSLFVQVSSKDRESVQKLIRTMEKETGYDLKVEADYTWITFFSDVSGISGVPSRYLGRLREGGIKAKGLELCRKDAPPLIKRTMEKCLSMLSQATSEAELKEALIKALRLVKKREAELYSGLVEENELVIERRISKPLEKYCKRVSHVLVAMRLASVSEMVRYIESQIPYPVDFGFMGYSVDKYASWLRRAAEPLRQMLNTVFHENRELHNQSKLMAE